MPSVASVVAVSIGLIVLVGWAFNADRLTRFDPNFVAMNPATAVLIVASGIAVALRLSRGASRATVVVAKILAVAVASLAMAQLFEMTGLWDSPVDEVLFPDRLWDARHQIMNRMAPNSALSLVMVGLSILTIDPSGRRLISQTLAILVGFIAVISIIGYTYGVQSLTGVGTFIPMTLPAAITFLFLAGGLLFAVPHAPLIEPFATDDPRGVLARRLFPLAIFLILFLGWVCVWGVRHGVFDNTFGTALYAISLSIFFVILIRWTVATVGKLEMERAEMTARLHDLNRRKDEMIAVVSHDLCSPLTGFRMVIDLLREKHQQPTDELLGLMDKSARRMVSMVRGLLDISKLQAEKVELELEDVLLSEVVQQAMEPLIINANAKHIELRLHPAIDEPTVRADRLRVSQIFSNLLTNALKFTSSGGAVDVVLKPKKDVVQVEVRDTGLGIPRDEMPHIFEKYRQTRTKATAGETGAGLGLAIVREMVLLHGGRISVSSEVNRGSVFSVCLPKNPAANGRAPL